jgi:hypothetical protein
VAIWWALRKMRGSYSWVRNICSQAKLLQKINKTSQKKVRQNKLTLSLRGESPEVAGSG